MESPDISQPAPGRGALPSLWSLRLSWPLLTGLAVYLYCFQQNRRLLGDGDTLWHIAAGQWMIQHGTVPDRDPFSHTMAGAPWTAHEWFSEVLLAAAHAAGGLPGVIALTALAFALAIALLTRALLWRLEPIHALMFAAFAVALTAGHLLARPHVLAMPFMILWTGGLVQARDEGRAPSLVLLPILAVWANLHGGFTLGIALALAFGVEAILDTEGAARRTQAKHWALFLALALASALLTPHGFRGILFTWEIFTENSLALQRVAEWRSPDFREFGPLELWLLGGLAVVLYQGLRLPLVRLLLLVGLLHLALKHARYMELLGLLVPLFIATPLAAQWRQAQQSKPQLEGADRFLLSLAPPAGKGALAASSAVLLAVPLWFAHAQSIELPSAVAPHQAVQAARGANLKGPVLNGYSWGGYLIYQGIPPFIDGRADMYGDAFFREYVAASQPRSWSALQAILDKYGIAWTLLPHESPAAALLDLAPGWRRHHADETAVIHVRSGQPEAAVSAPAR